MRKLLPDIVLSNLLVKDSRVKCSVILLVYTRTEFVNQALLSLENQDIDKNLFEVLIISNVEIKLERNYNLNMQIVKSDRTTLAEKLAEGILLARNPVVTFLEDDDLYCRERIFNVKEAFEKYEGLTYYHNASSHFHISPRPGRLCRHATKLNDINLAMRAGDINIIRDYEKLLDKRRADFNLSSMAFRKDFLLGYADLLSSLGTRYVDSFLFFIAIFTGNLILVDDRVLTETRVHLKNASQTVKVDEISAPENTCSEDMVKVVSALGHLKILDEKLVKKWLEIRSFDDIMKGNGTSRRNALITIINLLKRYRLSFARSDVAKKGVLYVVSPKFMRKMLDIFHST
jgi:hypothetical protein